MAKPGTGALLVRSWNVFHGNALPPDHRSHLQAMIRLATADRPDVLCLQEVPLWALPRLARWSGMTARWTVTRQPWLPDWLGGFVTRLNNGVLRSAISGQANAILLGPRLQPRTHHALRIDEDRREPRYCHAVRTDRLLVANLHATNDFRTPEVPAAEIRRAEAFVLGLADDLPCVLAGDFNLRAGQLVDLPELVGAKRRDRSRARPRPRRHLALDLAGGPPPPQWPRALGSRAGRGDDRMTFEEARALFPVLERVAYLNAGTFGPLARPTLEAMQAELDADGERGRLGKDYFERVLGLRDRLRERFADLVAVEPEHVTLTSSTTDGCNIVLAGLDVGPEDEIVTTPDEHPGLVLPLHASGAHVVVAGPDPDEIVAAVTPRTRLLALSHVLWTSGAVLPVGELKARTGLRILVDGAQSVGAIPVDAQGLDFYTISGQKWLCGPDSTGALVVADPETLRIGRPSYFAQASFEPDGSFVARDGAARFDANWLSASALSGLLAALELAPEWRFEHAAKQAARCRALLAGKVELVDGGATLVAFRHVDCAGLVARLAERDVAVREIPGRNLVRVSCGWWTSDDDLERLAAAL